MTTPNSDHCCDCGKPIPGFWGAPCQHADCVRRRLLCDDCLRHAIKPWASRTTP